MLDSNVSCGQIWQNSWDKVGGQPLASFHSAKTISNVFKKITGNAPLKFIHDRIMVEARNMLAYSNLEVSQIGYDLGFQDVQAFSRFFKRYQELLLFTGVKEVIEESFIYPCLF